MLLETCGVLGALRSRRSAGVFLRRSVRYEPVQSWGSFGGVGRRRRAEARFDPRRRPGPRPATGAPARREKAARPHKVLDTAVACEDTREVVVQRDDTGAL